MKDWDIRINYGIKTGCNEAFIIDEMKKEELIAEDPKSAEIIRPILRGRDIKRYGYNFAGLYLIATHNGIPEKGISRIKVEDYPAVKRHLDKYRREIKARYDKGDTPYNLRSCAYWEDFSKQKIIWGEISDRTKFALDTKGQFAPEATTFLMTGSHLEFLLCYLNSLFSEYLFSKIGTTTGMGTVRWKKFKLESLCVLNWSLEREKKLIPLLSQLQINGTQDERMLNSAIYELIGLTQEEISFIETSVATLHL